MTDVPRDVSKVSNGRFEYPTAATRNLLSACDVLVAVPEMDPTGRDDCRFLWDSFAIKEVKPQDNTVELGQESFGDL